MAILVIGVSLLMHGCKRDNSVKSTTPSDDLATAKALLKEQIKRDGQPITVPVNQKINAFYADKAGNPIPKEQLLNYRKASGNNAAIISACDYSNSPAAILNSYTLYFDCIQGIQVSWNYTISSNNNIAVTNGAQSSKGKFYLYDASNTLIYSNLSVTPANVVDAGPDNSNPGYELFSVTFSTGWLNNTNFNFSYTTKLGATLVTDCSDIEAFPIALQAYAATAYQFPATNPCNRIDPVYVNHSTAPFRIWGEDPVGVCNGVGYTYPDLQEINFSIDGGAWIGGSTTSTSLTYFIPPPVWTPYPNFNTLQMGYVDPYGVTVLQLGVVVPNLTDPTHTYYDITGTHTIQTRFRNISFYQPASYYGGTFPVPNPGTNCCVGSWSTLPTATVTYP